MVYILFSAVIFAVPSYARDACEKAYEGAGESKLPGELVERSRERFFNQIERVTKRAGLSPELTSEIQAELHERAKAVLEQELKENSEALLHAQSFARDARRKKTNAILREAVEKAVESVGTAEVEKLILSKLGPELAERGKELEAQYQELFDHMLVSIHGRIVSILEESVPEPKLREQLRREFVEAAIELLPRKLEQEAEKYGIQSSTKKRAAQRKRIVDYIVKNIGVTNLRWKEISPELVAMREQFSGDELVLYDVAAPLLAIRLQNRSAQTTVHGMSAQEAFEKWEAIVLESLPYAIRSEVAVRGIDNGSAQRANRQRDRVLDLSFAAITYQDAGLEKSIDELYDELTAIEFQSYLGYFPTFVASLKIRMSQESQDPSNWRQQVQQFEQTYFDRVVPTASRDVRRSPVYRSGEKGRDAKTFLEGIEYLPEETNLHSVLRNGLGSRRASIIEPHAHLIDSWMRARAYWHHPSKKYEQQLDQAYQAALPAFEEFVRIESRTTSSSAKAEQRKRLHRFLRKRLPLSPQELQSLPGDWRDFRDSLDSEGVGRELFDRAYNMLVLRMLARRDIEQFSPQEIRKLRERFHEEKAALFFAELKRQAERLEVIEEEGLPLRAALLEIEAAVFERRNIREKAEDWLGDALEGNIQEAINRFVAGESLKAKTFENERLREAPIESNELKAADQTWTTELRSQIAADEQVVEESQATAKRALNDSIFFYKTQMDHIPRWTNEQTRKAVLELKPLEDEMWRVFFLTPYFQSSLEKKLSELLERPKEARRTYRVAEGQRLESGALKDWEKEQYAEKRDRLDLALQLLEQIREQEKEEGIDWTQKGSESLEESRKYVQSILIEVGLSRIFVNGQIEHIRGVASDFGVQNKSGISEEEVNELWKRLEERLSIEAWDAAISKIQEGHLRIPLSIILGSSAYRVNVMDEIQNANDGLRRAALRYDPRAVGFFTYAEPWIYEALGRSRLTDGISLGKGARADARELTNVREELTKSLGRAPFDAELQEELGWDNERFVAILGVSRGLVSVDQDRNKGGDSDYKIREYLERTDDGREAEDQDRQTSIVQLIDRAPLKEMEKKVLTDRYFRGMVWREVEDANDLTEAQTRSIEAAGLNVLFLTYYFSVQRNEPDPETAELAKLYYGFREDGRMTAHEIHELYPAIGVREIKARVRSFVEKARESVQGQVDLF